MKNRPTPKKAHEVLPGLGRIGQKFWPEIRQQKKLLIAAMMALLAETGFRLLEPWPMKFIFDEIIIPSVSSDSGKATTSVQLPLFGSNSTLLFLTVLVVGIIMMAGLRAITAYWSTAWMAIAANQIMADVRARLYIHVQHLSLAFHSKAKSGDLIARVTYDIERLRDVTVTAALPLVTNTLTLVGMLSVMFWMNQELAFIATAVFPFFIVSTLRFTRKIQVVSRKQRQQEGAMAATAAESIGAIKVVQALSLQGQLEQSFTRQNNKNVQQGTQAKKLAAGLERTVEVLVAVAIALVLWRGVQLIQQRTVTPGDLLVFMTYLKTAFKPMRQMAKYTGQIAKATASGERVVDILDTLPDVQDSRGAWNAPPFKGAVQFHNVSFGYESERLVLNGINLSIEPGQQVALVGPSGSGKSSLTNLLMRFYDPWEGSISIDGHDLREYTLASLRRQFSIILQDSILFAASVRENIAYGSLTPVSSDDIEDAARLANAHDFILDLPQGYNTVLGERGATLSGGQRQRIAIARAIIRQSPIVILDEPTTGLDSENEHLVSEALERLTKGRTTFWISHNLKAIERADQILYLENGQLLEQGTHTELLQQNGAYAALYQRQAPPATPSVFRREDSSVPSSVPRKQLLVSPISTERHPPAPHSNSPTFPLVGRSRCG